MKNNFTRVFCQSALLHAFVLMYLTASTQNLTGYVQPLSGTAASTTPASIKHGGGTELNANTIPAVTLPFAMTQWTPQTRATEKKCIPPYYYKDSLFHGIRGTHWISGSCMQDYGSFTIMPLTGKLKTGTADVATRYDHADESASPFLYKVRLREYALTVEVTATLRCGSMQFTAERDDSLYLLITPNSDFGKGFIKIDAANGEIVGYNPVHRIYQGTGEEAGFNGYFVIKIQQPIERKGTYSDGTLFSSDSISKQKNIGAYIGFKMKKGEKLRIRIGTSFSSLKGARNNLLAELHDDDFEATVQKCKGAWEKALGKIIVTTSNEKDKRIFYTSLYHAMQHPRLYNDVDGTYPKFSSKYQTAKLAKGNYYDDFSMWDIYRAQLPLFELLQPEIINDFVQSLIIKGQQGGWMPIFPCWNNFTAAMIGDHTSSVIASAYSKGIRNYNAKEAYRLLRQNAFNSPDKSDYLNGKGRRALGSYLKYGYIPLEDSVPDAFHKKEQVSRTLEYAYDDYALAQFAKALGKTGDFEMLSKRSNNYQHVFDAEVGLVRGRYADGKWSLNYMPDRKESFITEGTPRQYTFYVPHDVTGLATLMGGTKKLEQSLDSLFAKNEYWHGNEPGHQIPFMYNYTNAPWKTQKEVNNILENEYSDGPGGLSGNDDAGQMSAWYLFASMGFYPVNPVSGQYMLSAPIFDEVAIRVSDTKVFTIIARRKGGSPQYIKSVRLNGKIIKPTLIRYSNIINGGTLEVLLSEPVI